MKTRHYLTITSSVLIGIKLIDSLVNKKDGDKESTIKLPTIEIQFKNKLLSSKSKTNLSLANNVEHLATWLSKTNPSKINADEFSPITQNSSKQNEVIGVVLAIANFTKNWFHA